MVKVILVKDVQGTLFRFHLKLMLLHKPLATFAAFVRFDPGMDSFMDVLLLVRREALIAERARILKKGK